MADTLWFSSDSINPGSVATWPHAVPCRVNVRESVLAVQRGLLQWEFAAPEKDLPVARSDWKWSGAKNMILVPPSQPIGEILAGAYPNGKRTAVVECNSAAWSAFWGGPVDVQSVTVETPMLNEKTLRDNVWKMVPTDFQRLLPPGNSAGVDIRQLPVPPSATLESYDPSN
jgi:hypothetical protein